MGVISRIIEFVERSQSNKLNNKDWLDFAKVSKKNAKIIFDATGYDVTDFVHSMDVSDVNHTIKKHSIKPHEFALIPLIVSDFDKVEKGNKINTIKYTKKIGETWIYIEVLRSGYKQKKVMLKTMYTKT